MSEYNMRAQSFGAKDVSSVHLQLSLLMRFCTGGELLLSQHTQVGLCQFNGKRLFHCRQLDSLYLTFVPQYSLALHFSNLNATIYVYVLFWIKAGTTLLA